jgi:5-formyltetrahydrofolate cyclo-ligase
MTAFADKTALREHYLNLRAALSPEIRKMHEGFIFNKIYEIIKLRKSNVIHCFIGNNEKGEFPTLELITKLINEGYTVCGPKIAKGRKLNSYRITLPLNLAMHPFGVMEPTEEELIAPEQIDLVITPLLVSDQDYNRLGYGGGYYDRYLPSCSNAYKVGISYFPPIDKILGIEATDIPLDEVIWMG